MAEPRNQREALVFLSALDPSTQDIPERQLLLTHETRIVPIGRTSKRKSSLEASITNAYFDCPVMSRDHAELEMNDGEVVLRDVGSLHGTQHNRLPLRRDESRPVKTGDIVTFGMPIDRGSEKFVPYEVEAKIQWRPTQHPGQPITFQVPDDSDIEEISGEEDNGMVYAEQVLEENNFRPAPSDPIDLTANDPDDTLDSIEDQNTNASHGVKEGCHDAYVDLTCREDRAANAPHVPGAYEVDVEQLQGEKGGDIEFSGSGELGGSEENFEGLGLSSLDEPMTSDNSDEEHLSTQSSNGESDGFLDEQDEIDEVSAFSDENEGEEDEEEYGDENDEDKFRAHASWPKAFVDRPMPSFAPHYGGFPAFPANTGQQSSQPMPPGDKESDNFKPLPVTLPPSPYWNATKSTQPQSHFSEPAQAHNTAGSSTICGDHVHPSSAGNDPQVGSSSGGISMHEVQEQTQLPPSHQSSAGKKTEYFHAREENRRVLGLPPRIGSGEGSETPAQEKGPLEADAEDEESLSSFNKPNFKIELNNDLVKSGAKFLNTPLTNDFFPAAPVRAPSPVFDETSAYQFQMSKQAAGAEIDTDKPANMTIKAIVEDSGQEKATPVKRKADEISYSSPQEEEVVQPTRNSETLQAACQPSRVSKPEAAGSEQVNSAPTTPALSGQSDLPRPPKRLRRAAEVFGYAAIGGIAVMSALIATAPTL